MNELTPEKLADINAIREQHVQMLEYAASSKTPIPTFSHHISVLFKHIGAQAAEIERLREKLETLTEKCKGHGIL